MAKEGINGVFGRPRVGRGKSAKASDRLEEDAQAMETRLRQLRVAMLEEKQKRDKELPLKHAGNRWRSAREDRGSVRAYAKDVHQKTSSSKTKKKDGSDRLSSSKKDKKSKKSSSRQQLAILSPATVEKWTVPQVLEWLSTIGLEECQSGFEFHQVSGKVLLGLTPDKCVQFGLSKLSSRNRLLAELEQIRDQQAARSEAAEIIDPKLRDTQPEVSSPTSKLAAKTHWSHVTPLVENAVDSDGEVPINLADGEFDEDAGHASFMKALLEWREGDAEQTSAKSNQDDEWVNPMLNGFNDDPNEENNGGGALLEGTYDEAEAQKSFQEALMAWRNGGNNNSSESRSLFAPVEQSESGCTPSELKGCWQCYRVVQADVLVHDEQTKSLFVASRVNKRTMSNTLDFTALPLRCLLAV